MAGRCLGELVRKMGERVLAHIIPILQQGMAAPGAATRQGVCTGLREVLDNISRQQLAEHLGALLPTVQAALVDTDPGVRQARYLLAHPTYSTPLAHSCASHLLHPSSIISWSRTRVQLNRVVVPPPFLPSPASP